MTEAKGPVGSPPWSSLRGRQTSIAKLGGSSRSTEEGRVIKSVVIGKGGGGEEGQESYRDPDS